MVITSLFQYKYLLFTVFTIIFNLYGFSNKVKSTSCWNCGSWLKQMLWRKGNNFTESRANVHIKMCQSSMIENNNRFRTSAEDGEWSMVEKRNRGNSEIQSIVDILRWRMRYGVCADVRLGRGGSEAVSVRYQFLVVYKTVATVFKVRKKSVTTWK